MRLSVIVKAGQRRGSGPVGGVVKWKKKKGTLPNMESSKIYLIPINYSTASLLQIPAF